MLASSIPATCGGVQRAYSETRCEQTSWQTAIQTHETHSDIAYILRSRGDLVGNSGIHMSWNLFRFYMTDPMQHSCTRSMHG